MQILLRSTGPTFFRPRPESGKQQSSQSIRRKRRASSCGREKGGKLLNALKSGTNKFAETNAEGKECKKNIIKSKLLLHFKKFFAILFLVQDCHFHISYLPHLEETSDEVGRENFRLTVNSRNRKLDLPLSPCGGVSYIHWLDGIAKWRRGGERGERALLHILVFSLFCSPIGRRRALILRRPFCCPLLRDFGHLLPSSAQEEAPHFCSYDSSSALFLFSNVPPVASRHCS